MATKTFSNGSETRYEPDSRATMNGQQGIIWIYRRLCHDGSGWAHMGKQFNPLRATRKEIALSFGHDYTPEKD